MSERTSAAIKLVFSIALVALITVFAKSTLKQVSFFTFIWLQLLSASIAMIIYTFILKKEKFPKNLPRQVWLIILGIGVLNFAIVRTIFIYALDVLPVNTHAYIMNFVGIVTMVLSALLLRERPGFVQIVGAVIALVGIRFYFYQLPGGNEIEGIIWLSIAVLCLAATNILMRQLHLLETQYVSNNMVATLSICVGAFPLVILGAIIDYPLPSIGARDWLVIILNGLIAIGLVMVVFNQVMKVLRAYEASILATSGVIFTAIFAMPILGDYLELHEIVGVLLMITGIALVQFYKNVK
ncbi:DMT family transporter [Aliikangiella coralliicola]|uniref:DMT family transporter n=1 Tax=Aliikangiella coralliicola TaxID=2592383 RepID=A0A545UD42_9GAMM|nr:DMT family transporter [Aliikangiella coralliicola]TQV87381.1 DMT family transporter [Aliikangiella coralliicola]